MLTTPGKDTLPGLGSPFALKARLNFDAATSLGNYPVQFLLLIVPVSITLAPLKISLHMCKNINIYIYIYNLIFIIQVYV